MRKNKKKKIKSERGSITLFTLATMLFFTTILMTSYAGQINKVNNQKKQIQKIQKEYNVKEEELDKAYNEMVNQ